MQIEKNQTFYRLNFILIFKILIEFLIIQNYLILIFSSILLFKLTKYAVDCHLMHCNNPGDILKIKKEKRNRKRKIKIKSQRNHEFRAKD